jgi:hypothetical protein
MSNLEEQHYETTRAQCHPFYFAALRALVA